MYCYESWARASGDSHIPGRPARDLTSRARRAAASVSVLVPPQPQHGRGPLQLRVRAAGRAAAAAGRGGSTRHVLLEASNGS